MKSYKVQNPVLIRFFNRPDKLKKLMDVIKKVKPSEIYLFSDGPKNELDNKLVEESRSIACDINWNCKVEKQFLNKNIGAPNAGYQGINWFFKSVEQGIVLEDDLIPNICFFKFCDELLEYYKTDARVGMVTGNNFQNGILRGDASYYCSKYIQIWGWASWRRSLLNWELVPKNWVKIKKKLLINKSYDDKYEKNFWEMIFNDLCSSRKVHWDFSLELHFWKKELLTITPNANLVSNIGFDEEATNTTNSNFRYSKMLVHNLGKIKHQKKIERNIEADLYTFNNLFGGKRLRFPYNYIRYPYRVLRYIFPSIKRFIR